MPLHFTVDSWIWIEDEHEKYIPCKVLKTFAQGEETTVLTHDGEKRTITEAMSAQVIACHPDSLDSSVQDLINISDLNAQSILHNLRIRFRENKIYTSISSILVSVNPFQLLQIYTPSMLEKYRSGDLSNPPHIFRVAFNAYNMMMNGIGDERNQSVVISGESGAGKSEATKLILQFLTDMSQRTSAESAKGLHESAGKSKLEQQLLASNPILEALGNAKTLRNNNSSRFGKLITVRFDNSGGIVGGEIINYLLEKSRVVKQTGGERNYHIFYQLYDHVKDNQKSFSHLNLMDLEKFHFTNQSGVTSIHGVNDNDCFEQLVHSFEILNFSKEDQDDMFRIIAGVLHFGNLQFVDGGDKAVVANPTVADDGAELWRINSKDIQKFLTCKLIQAGKSLSEKNYKVNEARDARDAMVKGVYAALFQLVVNRINSVLRGSCSPKNTFIGVLDIFGFESFKVNSFEQLCINYCNEKLQFHFNEHIFKMEQAVYAAEGIVISQSSFVDNKPTLELIELAVTGIFSLIDTQSRTPGGSDKGFLRELFANNRNIEEKNLIKTGVVAGTPPLVAPKPSKDPNALPFGINHYAGTIYYECADFLEKNSDQLNIDIMTVLKASSSHIVKEMLAPFNDRSAPTDQPSRGAAAKEANLGEKFKRQLADLISTLNSTHPHFVRCLKPNSLAKASVFDSTMMLEQLKCAGLVEVCRIRKLGYPIRYMFDDFYKRFKHVATDSICGTLDELIAYLVKKNIFVGEEWKKGNSRMFMRTGQSQALELAREAALTVHASKILLKIKVYIFHKKMNLWRGFLQNIKHAVQLRTEVALTKALDTKSLSALPYGGLHLETVKTAKLLLKRVLEEQRVCGELKNAIKARTLHALHSALKAAMDMKPPYENPPLFKEVNALIARIEEEEKLKKDIQSAMAQKSIDALVHCLETAKNMQFICDEVKQATVLCDRLKKEKDTLEKLAAACVKKDVPTLTALINECVTLGIDSLASVVSAKKLRDELAAEYERLRIEREARERAEREERERKEQAEREERARQAKEEAERQRILREEQEAKERLERAKREEEERIRREREAERLRIEAERQEAERKRAEAISAATANLAVALQTGEKGAISAALNEAIRVDLSNDDVMKAKSFIEKQRNIEECAEKIELELRILKTKTRAGVEKDDLSDLRALTKDTNMLKYVEDSLLESAFAALKLYTRQAEMNEELKESLKFTDAEAVRAVLYRAEDMNLENDIVTEVKEKVRVMPARAAAALEKKLQQTHKIMEDRRHSLAGSPVITQTEGLSGVSGEFSVFIEEAKHGRFENILKNFEKLRPPDNFARGMFFHKADLKSSFLVHQVQDIPKSLTMMTFTDHNKIALQVFRNIVGFMGDKIVQYPESYARDVLQKGIDYSELRTEIYMQIIKQLSNNPRPESIAKGWQLLCMCVATFSPSEDFRPFLLHFLLEKMNKSKGAIGDYAKYCLRALEVLYKAWGNESIGFPLSNGEIEAFRDRPPIVATFESVDGKIIADSIPIAPYQNVGNILSEAITWLDLHDVRSNTFGIFAIDTGEVGPPSKDASAPQNKLPRTPRPLGDDEYLGDIVVQKLRQRRGYKFVVKKKLFLSDAQEYPSADPNYERLVYIQAEKDIIIDGTVPVNDAESAVYLGAISIVLAFGDATPTTEAQLVDTGVSEFIPPCFRSELTPAEWAQEMLPMIQDLIAVGDPLTLQAEFLSLARAGNCHMFGTHWFYVFKNALFDDKGAPIAVNSSLVSKLQDLPRDLLLGFNYQGLHICDRQRKVLMYFGYPDVDRWGGNSSQFSIILVDRSSEVRGRSETDSDRSPVRSKYSSVELSFITTQAPDMAAIIFDFVNVLKDSSTA